MEARTPQDTGQGFLQGLFDTRFDTLVGPKVARVFYIIAIVLLAITLLIYVIVSFAAEPGLGVLVLILGPLVALLYLMAIRLYLEAIIVLFKIRGAVERIEARK